MSIVSKAEQIGKLFVEIVAEIARRLEVLEGGTPEYGRLIVTTTPVEGEVFVDGKSWGVGYVSVELKQGEYEVSFGAVDGYTTPDTIDVTIVAGADTIIKVEYTKIPSEINDFMIQYGNVDLSAIGATKYDLVVIDYARYGDATTKWTKEQIEGLRNSPGGHKTVLAYICPSMASDYRYYWKSSWRPGSPEWLGNLSNWAGSYWAKYWYKEWQNIIYGDPNAYVDQVIAQGFDGVFLDVVDAYWIWPSRPTAKSEMAEFVTDITKYSRQFKKNFFVLTNGGDGLHEYPEYVEAINGVCKESVYYGYGGDNIKTPPNATSYMEANLDQFILKEKLVFNLDYTQTPEQIDDSYHKAKLKQYINMCGVSSLNQLIINPGHEPD